MQVWASNANDNNRRVHHAFLTNKCNVVDLAQLWLQGFKTNVQATTP